MNRAKLATLAEGVVMSTPSPRVRVIWHHNQGCEHTVAYLGFDSAEVAETCYQWLLSKAGKYNRHANTGVNKPRKAERVEGYQFEIKWHAPHAGILATAIEILNHLLRSRDVPRDLEKRLLDLSRTIEIHFFKADYAALAPREHDDPPGRAEHDGSGLLYLSESK